MGDRDESLAGHSEADVPAADRGFATGDDERYREVRVVGSGGLGTVLLAHDQRLDRDVALKRIGPGADERSAAARFAREARITARLDHPGIVPIHDAGITADGRLFYTMRLIRGRALGELAAEATTIAARLALVPALTAACHAVGHAHRRGIVHRDLKPANVMIGEAGETQVVDWGLAEKLGVLAAGGPIAGTPAYLAPEVARGEPAGRAADVWALGAMLHEVLTGERRRRGDRDAVLAALRREPEPVRWDPAIPVELRAIAEQAMAAAPAARYPDAEAMAADLEAYRDGRRVRAHDYSAVELAWRAVVALRWPLAIAGALTAAVVISLAVTARRTERQRVRAVAAEQVAARARVRAEDALGQALASAAVAALDRGRAAHAEVLAAHALERGESPDARGVLAATTAGPRPATSERIDLPGCGNVLPAGYQLALCHLPDRLELWELAPLRMRWRRELRVAGALALASGDVIAWTADGELRSLAAAGGADVARLGTFGVTAAGGVTDAERTRAAFHDGLDLLVVVSANEPRRVERACGNDRVAAIAATPGETWVICRRGKLRSVRDDGVISDVRDTGFGIDYRPASALSVSEGKFSLAIGGLGGDVELHDLRPCFSDDCSWRDPVTRFRAVTTHAIRAIADDNNSAIVVADDGDAIRIDRSRDAERVALPVEGARDVALEEHGVVTGGRSWRRWSRAVSAPRRFHVAPGLTVAALAPGGKLIASAGEDGVAVLHTLDGDVIGGLEVGHGGVTAMSFSPDGAVLTVTRTSGELQTWSMDDRQVLLSTTPAPATPPPPPPPPADPEILATARSADGRWLAAATVTGRIDVRELPSRRLIARLHGHRQRATWVAFDGDTLWSGGWDGQLLRWNTRAFTAPAAELQAAAAATWHVTLDEALGRAIP